MLPLRGQRLSAPERHLLSRSASGFQDCTSKGCLDDSTGFRSISDAVVIIFMYVCCFARIWRTANGGVYDLHVTRFRSHRKTKRRFQQTRLTTSATSLCICGSEIILQCSHCLHVACFDTGPLITDTRSLSPFLDSSPNHADSPFAPRIRGISSTSNLRVLLFALYSFLLSNFLPIDAVTE